MAHPRRGHRSGTYEILDVVDVDLDSLAITIRHAAAHRPQTVRMRTDATPAAKEMILAVADSIKVGGSGDADSGWESAQTLEKGLFNARVMVERLHQLGYSTFSDDSLEVPTLRELYAPLSSNVARSACWLLARVIRDNHPRGQAIARALKNTRFMVHEGRAFAYDSQTAEAIERAARGVYLDAYTTQREVFERLGYDVSGRSWLKVPAQEVVDWAHSAHPQHCGPSAPQPSLAADFPEQVAWALTHPGHFGYVKGRRGLSASLRGPAMRQLGLALYPDNGTIVAALIVHCLGENAGYNLSVLLERSADELIYLGPEDALEPNVKARNKSQDTRPTRLNSIYTPGGVVEVMTGLTRFSRMSRAQLLLPDGRQSPVARRLYVEHTADPADSSVIESQRIHHGWRQARFDEHWDEALSGSRRDAPLRLAALRLVAQQRALGEGLKADVHGHNERTKMHYSAHVLPDYIFNAHATAAQDAFHDEAVRQFRFVAGATEGAAADLAAVNPDAVLDVEIGLCVSGGNDPDDASRPCGLGIVSCFTCPNGYRTVDHVPGLLAAVELADMIESNDPFEWETGQASQLKFYADACLSQFPPLVVANIRRSVDLVPHILTVTGMYMELRHG